MIPKECKRLAEVDFPIAGVSVRAGAEKDSRIAHIPRLHVWPAARPGGACRAVLLASLLPDPCDEKCPSSFLERAPKILSQIYLNTDRDRHGHRVSHIFRALMTHPPNKVLRRLYAKA
jgi:putative DNA methylase